MNQYYQVNWINGMRITADQFIELENHFIYRMQSTFRGYVNALNYGLVTGVDENISIPHFTLSLSHDRVTIVNGFVALTPEGHLVQIPSGMEFPVYMPNVQSDWYYLVVSARPYKRTAFGKIDERESPARYPYAMQEYRFEFFAPNKAHFHLIENNMIPIGLYNGIAFEEDKTYIPPCTSIQAHPVLLNLYKTFQETFSEMERKIITLLKTKDHAQNQMLANLLGFFSQQKTAIDMVVPYQPPCFLVEKTQQIARIIHYANKLKNIDALEDIVEFRYNHFAIKKSVDMVSQFLKTYSRFLPDDSRIRPF